MYKRIPSFPNYEIDENGNVVSYRYSKPKMLKHYITKGGAKLVALGGTTKTVSTLVMETFGPPQPTDSHQVWTIDENPLNTHISNLIWRERKNHTLKQYLSEETLERKRQLMIESWKRPGFKEWCGKGISEGHMKAKLNRLAEQGATDYDD